MNPKERKRIEREQREAAKSEQAFENDMAKAKAAGIDTDRMAAVCLAFGWYTEHVANSNKVGVNPIAVDIANPTAQVNGSVPDYFPTLTSDKKGFVIYDGPASTSGNSNPMKGAKTIQLPNGRYAVETPNADRVDMLVAKSTYLVHQWMFTYIQELREKLLNDPKLAGAHDKLERLFNSMSTIEDFMGGLGDAMRCSQVTVDRQQKGNHVVMTMSR